MRKPRPDSSQPAPPVPPGTPGPLTAAVITDGRRQSADRPPIAIPPPPPVRTSPAAAPTPAPAPRPALPVLTKPQARGAKHTNKLDLTGERVAEHFQLAGEPAVKTANDFRRTVDEMVERARQIEALETEQKMQELEVLDVVRAFRRREEAAGDFAKTVILHGGSFTPDVTWRDAYSKMDSAHEPVLRSLVGEEYDDLFARVRAVKPRNPEAAEEVLRKLLGAQFDALFEVEEFLRPQADFMAKRARIRGRVAPDVDAALDGIVDQVQHKPSFNHKRSLKNGG